MDRSEFERAQPTLQAIGGAAVLAAWEGDSSGPKALPQIAGQPLRAPILTLALTTTWGSGRILCAFNRPPQPADVDFAIADGTIVATASWPTRLPAVTSETLLAGLPPAEQVRALRFLLQSCRSAFGLGGHPAFVHFCRDVLGVVAPTPSTLAPQVDVVDGLVLCDGRLPHRFGRVCDVILVGEQAVRRNRHLPTVGPQGKLRLALEAAEIGHRATVVFFGEGALACREVDLGEPRPRLLRWLEQASPDHESREYLAACLAASDAPAAQANLREMQLLFPLAKASVTAKGKPLGGSIDLAVSHQAGGLFVAGWLHDPHRLIQSITAISATGRRIPLGEPVHRFPRLDIAQHYGASSDDAGFATYIPLGEDGAPSYQHRVMLTLCSGETLSLVAPPQPISAADARNAVLASVPPNHLSDTALVQAIAPAAASLHASHLATKRPPEIIDFGLPPANPTVSVVVPLYKVLDFLRFQIAAFAIDPAMAKTELIYVLDSPEQRGPLEHLLRGLHALYALPLRLLVMPGNFGFAAASNAGAAIARAPHVLFLNSDVVPAKAGWLPEMQAALEADARVAAAGPKLLFDDESLQHAGMYFDQDLTGKWFNLHYHKGLPRDFGPACLPRHVPAVTGACLLMRRKIIEQLGGFSEDYIIGDYEDSDLCLRLRDAGHEIAYVPSAELYHLERQSIQHHTGYTCSVAAAYNRRLHAERWGWLMEALCRLPAAQAKTVRRRRGTAA